MPAPSSIISTPSLVVLISIRVAPARRAFWTVSFMMSSTVPSKNWSTYRIAPGAIDAVFVSGNPAAAAVVLM